MNEVVAVKMINLPHFSKMLKNYLFIDLVKDYWQFVTELCNHFISSHTKCSSSVLKKTKNRIPVS